MTSNIAIGYNNKADTATLTSGFGSWSNLDNLKDYRLSKVASVTDYPAHPHLRFALAEPLHIGMVGLVGTNAGVNANQRTILYSDAAFTDVVYDSAVVDVYPPGTEPYGSAPWGHPSVWTGRPTLADASRYQRNIVHVLSQATMARYGAVIIQGANLGTAEGSGDTWTLGRLFVGQVLRPEIGVGYGALRLQPKTRTQRQDARDGTPYFDSLRAAFAMPITLDWLTQAESMRALDAQIISDISGEVLAVFQPDDPAYRNRHTLFGRLAELDPIEFPQYATYRNAFQLEGYL